MSIEVNAGVILTERGKQLIEASNATGRDIQLTQFGVGDGGVSGGKGAYNPTLEELRALTSVSGEFDKRNLQGATPLEGGGYVVEGNVPSDVGLGRWVRLFGLYTTDNELMYVFLFPEWEKPSQTGGMNLEIPFRATIGVGDVANITIKIDPSIVTASQQFVIKSIKEHDNDSSSHADIRELLAMCATKEELNNSNKPNFIKSQDDGIALNQLNFFKIIKPIVLPTPAKDCFFKARVEVPVSKNGSKQPFQAPDGKQITIDSTGEKDTEVNIVTPHVEYTFKFINGEWSV